MDQQPLRYDRAPIIVAKPDFVGNLDIDRARTIDRDLCHVDMHGALVGDRQLLRLPVAIHVELGRFHDEVVDARRFQGGQKGADFHVGVIRCLSESPRGTLRQRKRHADSRKLNQTADDLVRCSWSALATQRHYSVANG